MRPCGCETALDETLQVKTISKQTLILPFLEMRRDKISRDCTKGDLSVRECLWLLSFLHVERLISSSALMLRDQTVVPFVPGCPWTRAYPSRWNCGCTTRTQGLGRNPGRYVYARSQKRPFWVEWGVGNNAASPSGDHPLLLSSISLPSPSSPKMVSGSCASDFCSWTQSSTGVLGGVWHKLLLFFSEKSLADLLFLHVLTWLTQTRVDPAQVLRGGLDSSREKHNWAAAVDDGGMCMTQSVETGTHHNGTGCGLFFFQNLLAEMRERRGGR